MDTSVFVPGKPLTFIGKLRVVLACIVAIVLLRLVGWQVARPTDPEMALTLMNGGLTAWPMLFVLAAVAGVIGTVIIGRQLPDGGLFVAGVGLASLAWRGGSMQMMLAYHAGTTEATRQALMVRLATDCLFWASLMAAVWAVIIVVRQWLWQEPEHDISERDLPELDEVKQQVKPTPAALGWPALVVTAVISLFVVWMTIARTPVAPVARGQVIASVVGAHFLGAMTARYFVGITDTRWYILAVPLVALAGYLLGYLNADMDWAAQSKFLYYDLLAVTPPHALVRALPVEYIALGLTGVLAGYWSGAKMEYVAEQEMA